MLKFFLQESIGRLFVKGINLGDSMNIKTILAAACISLAGAAASASTMTYNVVGGFSGGQLGDVAFDLTITGDFSSDIEPSLGTTSGLTVNSLTSSLVPGDPFLVVAFGFGAPSNTLIFGGIISDFNGIIDDTTDLYVGITGFTSGSASLFFANDTLSTSRGIGFPSGSVAVTEVAPIPLPASVFFLLAGLAGLGAVARSSSRSGRVEAAA